MGTVSHPTTLPLHGAQTEPTAEAGPVLDLPDWEEMGIDLSDWDLLSGSGLGASERQ